MSNRGVWGEIAMSYWMVVVVASVEETVLDLVPRPMVNQVELQRPDHSSRQRMINSSALRQDSNYAVAPGFVQTE
jgi:hypothetical protein